jgi:hypothetical protein
VTRAPARTIAPSRGRSWNSPPRIPAGPAVSAGELASAPLQRANSEENTLCSTAPSTSALPSCFGQADP